MSNIATEVGVYTLHLGCIIGRPAGSYEFRFVSQSVSPSVSSEFFSVLVHYFFLIFYMKLGVNKRKKMTESDFSGKINPVLPFWGKRGSK